MEDDEMIFPTPRLALTLTVLSFCAVGFARNSSVMAQSELSFSKPATGGTLVLSDAWNPYPISAQIVTQHGESGESVLLRLGAAMTESWGWQPSAVAIADGTLHFPYMDYVLSGTEDGLGIPKAITGLSVSYNDNDSLQLNWQNASHYDNIIVAGDPFSTVLAGTESHCVVNDFSTLPRDNADNVPWISVYGVKDGLPSAGAAMALIPYGFVESLGYCGSDGLLSNWEQWGNDADLVASVSLSVETGKSAKSGFKQLLKNDSKASSGIFRRFVGLIPGHNYKVDLRVRTTQPLSDGSRIQFGISAVKGSPGNFDPFAGIGDVRHLATTDVTAELETHWKSIRHLNKAFTFSPQKDEEVIFWCALQEVDEVLEFMNLSLVDLTLLESVQP